MKNVFALVVYLSGLLGLSAQVVIGTNAPGAASIYSFVVGAGVTNLAFSVPGSASAYSHLFVKKGIAPTETSYDFSSRVNAQTNGIYLEQPEVSAGTYYIRVSTPAGSQAHTFSLEYATNVSNLRSAARPVSKPLGSTITSSVASGGFHYFRVEFTNSFAWRASLLSTQLPPDLYVGAAQPPTTAAYLKRSVNATNDVVAFTATESAPGVYHVGVSGANAPAQGVPYTLKIQTLQIVTLAWDPGLTHPGTQIHASPTTNAGDYYFRINTANPSLGAWRTALRVLSGEANLYLSRGVLPSANVSDFKSERAGSDGLLLRAGTQFQPSEDWYLLVQAPTNSQWTLVSGSPYVMDLGTVAADDSSGSGSVEIGPEGMRFFSASAPADMLAWRLWLNGATNQVLVKKTSLPLPLPGAFELSQPGQMLVVPPYLISGQYFIGVPGTPGTTVSLDSRQHSVTDLAYNSSVATNLTGFGYVTYRVQVPPQQIAWQMLLPSTAGNANMAVRRNTVPNENNNEAFSEEPGNIVDNIALVPPVLSDGTFYITVYSTNNSSDFTFQNGPATVTDINYIGSVVNDDPTRVGWRYYRVTDIGQQLGSLGWDLYLTNFVPGTRIAVRRNAAPSVWPYRIPTGTILANYYDALSTSDFLQRPGHQADVWYIGVYNPTNALGAFTLVTRELEAQPIADNVALTRSNVLNGRWEFFRVQLKPEDIQGASAIMGWDLRLVNVTAGMPRIVVRRDGFPTNLNTTFTTTGLFWPSGLQWAPAGDWTKRTFSADGSTNEDGRILSVGVGRCLEPGTYYIGILNAAGSTNNMSYTLHSRWIGKNRSIPVHDLNWSGGIVTNTVGPREAAYYRVVVPNTAASWKVRLTPTIGESMIVVHSNTPPSVETEKRVQKSGKEHYVMLPPSGYPGLKSLTNLIAVIGEGEAPSVSSRIGVGPSSFILESLGEMPEVELGTLSPVDLVVNHTLDGGESMAYHFDTMPGALGFWLFLEDRVGNPWMVSRGEDELADPGYGGDVYGNEGGQINGSVSGPDIITVADPYPRETIMVKARATTGVYPDASYTLRVKEIIPNPVAFDGGTYHIADQSPTLGSYYVIDVPPNAIGWDLRLTNVTSGSPQLVVSRDWLAIIATTAGFGSSAYASTVWPSGARIAAGSDLTGRDYSPEGVYEGGRVMTFGMGRPLEPGRYYVTVMGSGGGFINGTLVSRGIGPGFSIPIADLNFAGGQITGTNLAPREAAYFRVNVPTNSTSWKVQLSSPNGESLLAALKGTIPNTGAAYNTSVTNTGGRKMQKIGDEQLLVLPLAGSNYLTSGYYYLAVVSEGQDATNATRIGTGAVNFTLTSFGAAPTNYLGDLAGGELADTNSLGGGEVRLYQFNVPAGVQTVDVRLENTTGNPTMAVVAGTVGPDPGASKGTIQTDWYGNEAGQPPYDVKGTFLNIVNPTNGIYTLAVKARSLTQGGNAYSNAAYTLRIRASTTIAVDFDQGSVSILNQTPNTWRYFSVVVPTNALGWDVRLVNVLGGLPRIVVRRETFPNTVATTPWSAPGMQSAWPTNSQWAPTVDWTKRTHSVDGSVVEDGRVLAMGLNRPLQPGNYIVGVMNGVASTNMTYTLLSRGIGPDFSIPVVDLPFVGSATNLGLMARDAAYYRVVVPSNSPSWRVQLSGITGESMLAGLRTFLPNFDTINNSGTLTNGKSMQKPGNEHYVMLPPAGQTNIPFGTNYLAVISEGVNPGSSTRIGSGSSSFVITSHGALPILDLGMVTSEDLVQPDSLEGGQVKAYQFTVPSETYGVKVRLDNRVNNPMAVAIAGSRIPDPGVAGSGFSSEAYGNEGGYASTDVGPTIVTLPNPVTGFYTLAVKARQLGQSFPDASYTLRVQEILAPELNFSSDLNTNGLVHETSGLLQDNERAFFKIQVPSEVNGRPVIGWKLDLAQSSGLASMRVRKDLLPADANSGSQMPFTTASAIIAPPYLTNGTWFVEVKGAGSTAFTLRSSALTLERPAWVMPEPGAPSQTPGVTLPMFADTGVGTNGLSIGGDESIFLEQGSLHYYAVEVPDTNVLLLRAQLEAISGNPDLYLRVGSVPTLYHNLAGASGTIFDRSMLASSGTEYANWVPIDGKIETRLKPGLWYLAVRAASNANARYRLRLSVGTVTELPIHGPDLANQIVAGGDWRYYRLQVPTTLPLSFDVTFSQLSGDVVMYVRDVIPPGNGISGTDYRHWGTDSKNGGPYDIYDPPKTYSFKFPPVRPGEPMYFGFRAVNDATFSVRITTNGVPVQEPPVLDFYNGSLSSTLEPYSAAVIRVDVPPEAVRWKHTSIHSTNISMSLAQGTLPVGIARAWSGSSVNSSANNMLVTWNATLKQYVPASWPWVPGMAYFFLVTNTGPVARDFTIAMDGKNALTDDNDNDAMADAWELFHWGNTGATAAADPDGDGISNFDEYQEGTSPVDGTDFRARLFIVAANGVVIRTPDQASYAMNSTAVLTAIPTNGYAFIGWSGDATGHANPLMLTMDGHKTVTARFKRAGDDFITALPFSGAVAYGTNVSFSKETGEPYHAGNPGGKSIWWRWTAPFSGPVTFTTAGTPFNTLLGIYTGSSVSGLSLIGSNNNWTGGTNRSLVTFNAVAGTTYNLAVDGYNGASGRIILSLSSDTMVTTPAIGPISRISSTVQFTISGDANRSYTLQTSTNLVHWDTWGTLTTGGDGTANFSEPIQTGSRRFYRARFP